MERITEKSGMIVVMKRSLRRVVEKAGSTCGCLRDAEHYSPTPYQENISTTIKI